MNVPLQAFLALHYSSQAWSVRILKGNSGFLLERATYGDVNLLYSRAMSKFKVTFTPVLARQAFDPRWKTAAFTVEAVDEQTAVEVARLKWRSDSPSEEAEANTYHITRHPD